jgi:hypothetical protein
VAAYLCVELADMVVKNDIRRGSLIFGVGYHPYEMKKMRETAVVAGKRKPNGQGSKVPFACARWVGRQVVLAVAAGGVVVQEGAVLYRQAVQSAHCMQPASSCVRQRMAWTSLLLCSIGHL